MDKHPTDPDYQPSPLLKFFDFEHLPMGPMQDASARFCKLAWELERTLPNGPEKTVALRKLLEAKDCAVRSVL